MPPQKIVKKYGVYAKVVGSKFLGTVEASDAQELREKVQELEYDAHVSLCHQCSGECEDPEIVETYTSEEE